MQLWVSIFFKRLIQDLKDNYVHHTNLPLHHISQTYLLYVLLPHSLCILCGYCMFIIITYMF